MAVRSRTLEQHPHYLLEMYVLHPIHPERREARAIAPDRRRQRHQRFSRQRPESQHHRKRRRARDQFPGSRRESGGTEPRGAKDIDPLHGVHHHACHEARIQRPTTPWEPTQTRLDELVVQLGRSDGEDGRGKVGRGEPMCEDMDRQEDEGCIGGDAQRAREFAWLLGGGCDESPGNT